MSNRKNEIIRTLEKQVEAKRINRILSWQGYPKQKEFFEAGHFDERMLCAGNQLGKSEAGAYEMACHLTGIYPDDWSGRKFDHPIVAWAAGVTGVLTRDVMQAKLFGPPGLKELLGTGMVPKERIVGEPSTQRGVTDLFDTVHVRHSSGGISSITFKSYEAGWQRFMGKSVDVIWLDEEPEALLYYQCIARTLATGGMVYTTYTPEQGYTELVNRFFKNDEPKHRKLIRMRASDCPHMTPDKIAKALAGVPKWQHEMRLNGEPVVGHGRVFSLPREQVSEPTLQYIPEHWAKLWGLDFGVSEEHKFAAVLIAWDKEKDVIHVIDAYKLSEGGPLQHAVRMKQTGILVPVAWPHDGWAVWQSRGATEPLAKMYKAQGLKMCGSHATFEGGGYDTEAGLLEMEQRFITGRLKVAAHLEEWFQEYMQYSRKDGQVIKKFDDLMSASRIAVMTKREARPVVLGSHKPDPGMQGYDGIAKNAELSGDDLF